MPAAVAHVVLSLDPGGTERLVLDLARRCAQTLRTRVFCLDRPGDWAARLDQDLIPVDVVGRRPGLDFRVATRLRRLASRHAVSVLHCHQYTPFVYGALSSLPARSVRVVYTEHGRLSEAPPARRRMVANTVLSRIPTVIAAVSGELRDFMIAEGFPGDRVDVVHNGIDPGPVPTAADRATARAAMGLEGGDFIVGTAARLDPVKNLAMAIGAVGALARTVSNARLVIIGDGPERRSLEAMIPGEFGTRVRWLGYREDARFLLPGFDVYLNTSVSEGVSVTILEAMAAALPVVATAVGGTPEVVISGLTGLLVPSRDVRACVAALEQLAAEKDSRLALAEAGRDRVCAHFAVERMLERYMRAYEAS